MDVQQIKISLIDPQPWNSRLPKWGAALAKSQAEFEALKESMDPAKGGRQIEPIVIHRTNGPRFILGIGSRRLAAARELEWETIAADVRDGDPTAEENIIENVRREALSNYEIARSCLYLREQGKHAKEVATIMGIAHSTVGAYCVMVKELAEPIQSDWCQDVPAAKYEILRTLAIRKRFPTDEDQLKAWESVKGRFAKAEEMGEKEPVGKMVSGKKEKEREEPDDEEDKPEAPTVPMARCPVCTKQAPKSIVSQYLVKLKPAALKKARAVSANMRKPAKKRTLRQLHKAQTKGRK